MKVTTAGDLTRVKLVAHVFQFQLLNLLTRLISLCHLQDSRFQYYSFRLRLF